jgi:hypothetical protein
MFKCSGVPFSSGLPEGWLLYSAEAKKWPFTDVGPLNCGLHKRRLLNSANAKKWPLTDIASGKGAMSLILGIPMVL